VQDNGVWRKRYNHELYELFNEPDIVKYIKINTLGWAGHVICVDNNRTVKKVFNAKPIGIRKIGRPKLRWEGDVIQELEERSNGKGNLAVASEEGQGPRRAVEPMMRMMISINVQLSLHITVINIGLKSNFCDTFFYNSRQEQNCSFFSWGYLKISYTEIINFLVHYGNLKNIYLF
jgi:hypothetical protein